MADKIIRVLAKDAPVKASAITAKEMVERSRQIHKTLPVATAALGRSLMAASMMGNQLKEKDGSVTLRIKGGGPLGSIIAVSDSQGNVRGYLQNGQVELPLKGPGKLDVGAAVGQDGTLTVILKQPQQPVTAEMLGITPKDTGLPLVVVSDGKMVPRSLELLHLSPADIERRLKNQSIAVEDVFLMTLDDCGNTFLQKKEGRV